MMFEEFQKIMIEKCGWCFPYENYPRIEEVYTRVNESKEEFCDYCITRDMNGIELLYRHRTDVSRLAAVGLCIMHIHSAVVLLQERDERIAGLINEVALYRDTGSEMLEKLQSIENLIKS